MRNLRKRYSYAQRKEFQETINDLREYILPLLRNRQGHVCNKCKKPIIAGDIDHKIYNPMMTIDDLQLLCEPCHIVITDYSHVLSSDRDSQGRFC
jgi:5-methylcytosine-specific restriction endonuclease McrA